MAFIDRLQTVQEKQSSLVCVGLDTDPRLLPAHLQGQPDAVLEFNRLIIEATHDLVCAYKMNLAFYEILGEHGWSILKRTLKFIPSSVLTIGDGKRGDIGNSSDRYARALFQQVGFDAVTVHPYMGFDSIEPFLKDAERGVFVLTLTSNPGSKDFQRLAVGTAPLYLWVARAAQQWNTKRNVGLVVGATHPKQLKLIRRAVPDLPILIPGVGAQGGDLKTAVRFGCVSSGNLALITVSRSIIYASSGKDFAEAARTAAQNLRDEIRRLQKEFASGKHLIEPLEPQIPGEP
ncbi:MAG TPA: orotidine-5'-phosphate decarboxylase [Bacteroidota bacterium]|nr:orotidine-5'-phosphate decarboxylase [Bacteroidota bacterium]